jgi:hypothetical protein
MAWKAQIECFLRERLALTLHPRKTVIQRCKQGADFLGAIVHPGHRLSRQRTVRALRRRISWFNQLLGSPSHLPPPLSGHWHRWLANHPPLLPDGSPSLALLQRILATLNSYYGFFSHANTVKSYFVANGIPADKVTAVGKGETETKMTETCKAKKLSYAKLKDCLEPDRRVEVEITGVQAK